jgi:hypothetical protein
MSRVRIFTKEKAMQDDFGNDLFGDAADERTPDQNWRVIEFFGLCDADHNGTFVRENAF